MHRDISKCPPPGSLMNLNTERKIHVQNGHQFKKDILRHRETACGRDCYLIPVAYLARISILGCELGPGGDHHALGENRRFSSQNMFTSLYPFNSVIVRYFPSKFAHMHLYGIRYQWLWPNCCKSSSFGDTGAMICDNACRREPYGTSVWPRSLHEPSIHRE